MSDVKRAVALAEAEQGVSGGAHAGISAAEAEADLFRAFEDEVQAVATTTISAPARRGPGRPAGSVNRTTKQLQRFLLQRGYRDPAEMLAALASMDTAELGDALCAGLGDDGGPAPAGMRLQARLKALDVQRGAAAELMAYFHQRMPAQIDVATKSETRALFIIADGRDEQNQTLSLHVSDASDSVSSDGGQS